MPPPGQNPSFARFGFNLRLTKAVKWLLIINGGEHFFHGRLTELRQAVMDFVADSQ